MTAPRLDTTPGPKGRSWESLLGIAHRHRTQWATGDGVTTEYALETTILRLENLSVFVGGMLLRPSDRGTAHDYAVRGLTAGYEGDTNRVRFSVAPGVGVDIALCTVGG